MKFRLSTALISGLLLITGALGSACNGSPQSADAATVGPTSSPPASKPLSPLGASDALQELVAGNQRFVSGKLSSCFNAPATRSQLTSSQAPDAIVLSCSDSRVPPEQVFDQGLGKLFVVRVAGNILNAEAIASMEYAVSQLGTHLIVILGHESCGAVKAAIDTPEGQDAGSPSLDQLLSEIRANLGDVSSFPPDPTLRGPVMKNVSAVASDLLSRSKVISDAVASGKLRIVQGIYELGSGKVDFWNG